MKRKNEKHGQTKYPGRMSPTYVSWVWIKRCCNKKNYSGYKYRGALGIKMCKRWEKSYKNFVKDMGARPMGKTIHRIDPKKDYCKKNCEWIKSSDKVRKDAILISYKGRTMSIRQWSELLGIAVYTLSSRLRNGYTIEQILGFRDRTMDLKKERMDRLKKVKVPKSLSRDEQILLYRKIGFIYEDIGDFFGITRQRVEQICHPKKNAKKSKS